ncbi:VCBS domain-containing protein [Bradyrhizobium lablabi]|uniref:VCBS domain-containing protein n=1 Tax=Bradyrhizobium lablabi TaxID=722472 RepID=UPI002010E246|nr:VCBS domain-containing protein [Bradyrhizobium lablabi]
MPRLDAHAHGQVHADSVSAHVPPGAIVVQDVQLLFTGDYRRSGVDLILSKDDRELVVHDYFRGEKRAPLASPDGAHLTGDIVNALTGYTQFAQAGGAADAPKVIGHVSKLTGNATAIRNGVAVVLNQGDNVFKGDVVQSGSASTLGITFIDGTVFGLGANAKMVLNEMVYDPNGSNNSSLLSLVQGTISFVAGATAKHGDMKVDTPVATMGIRGTAVLVEIDFEVPGAGGAPPAKFQVLVEPDGTSGSYILFDKTTLNPIATVNQPGTQTIVNSQGNVSFLSSAPLSDDAQKIINDVFSLRFTDNTNPNTKLTSIGSDTVIPISTSFKLASGDIVTPTVFLLNLFDKPAPETISNTIQTPVHIPGSPEVVADDASFTEQPNVTQSAFETTISGKIRWADINPGDLPTGSASFTSFAYKDAHNNDITASLTPEQLAAIKAVSIALLVEQDPGNKNVGSASWTYSVGGGAFDFLAAGETLTVTYTARVDNNFGLNNETAFRPFTITITGTNDAPAISAAGGAITGRIGSGSTAIDTVTGTIAFADVDLSDRPVASAAFSSFIYLDARGQDVTAALAPEQLAAIKAVEVPLSVVQAAGNTHDGSATWTYSIQDKAFDFIAKGETLILTYVATVDDGHGGVTSTTISVSISGADGTNDVPVITSGVQAAAITEVAAMKDSVVPDTASGAVSFIDPDLSDTHAVTITGVAMSGVATGLADQATVLSWLSLGTLVDSTNGVTGSQPWTFSAADKNFDYLAFGETLTLTYTIEVDDHHGGVASQPVKITVTGTNDAPVAVADSDIGHIVEAGNGANGNILPGVPSTTGDVLANDTDVDMSDTHEVIGVAAGTASGALLGDVGTTVIGTYGSLVLNADGTWTYMLDNSKPATDALAKGEHVSDVFSYTESDHHGGISTTTLTIDVTGTNDAPTLANADAGTLTDTAADDSFGALVGKLNGHDVDNGETATLTYAALDASHHSVNTAIKGLYGSLTVNADGTYTYVPDEAAINGLPKGDYADSFAVQATDVQGAAGVATLTVHVTGANDTPAIVGKTDPSALAIMVPQPTTIVLDHGVDTNSLGLPTETFDGQPAGTASNNGAGAGDFYSAALDATFSGTGHAGVVRGAAPGATAPPFIGDPGAPDATNYLSIGGGGSETISFASEKQTFGLYWGSVDSYNSVAFYHGATLVASYTGADVAPLFSDGGQSSFSSNGYVEFTGLPSFDKVVLSSSSNAFEIDNISAGSTPPLDLSVSGTLTVEDRDVGDHLTVSVIGDGAVEYNGSTKLPDGADVAALIDAGDLAFDSAVSDGGSQLLHWTYHATNPDLDFLHAGDVLKIHFTAQVNDGHGNVGAQDLTVTLVGTDQSGSGSAFSAVSTTGGLDLFANAPTVTGTAGNDTLVGSSNDDLFFGNAGNDTFVFNESAGGIGHDTIDDFMPGADRMKLDYAAFDPNNPQDFSHWLSGHAVTSGNDVLIDLNPDGLHPNHDTILLKSVVLASLRANDFILPSGGAA